MFRSLGVIFLFILASSAFAFEPQTNDTIAPFSNYHYQTDTTTFIYSTSDTGGVIKYYRDLRIDTLFAIQKNINAARQGIPGYRVQLYRGNSQRRSKERAQEIVAMVYKKMGESVDVEMIFKTPYWRVQTGNFRLPQEAMKEELRLKKAFPEIADDISVVPATIHFPKLGENSDKENRGQ